MPKPLPADTWQNLFYPPPDYKYFENADQFDFEPNANGFSWKNAWWLADAALLAYVKDWNAVVQNLTRARFDTTKQIGAGADKHTKGFFASRSGSMPFAVVAFRGTDKDDPKNSETDANTVPLHRDGYILHTGFALALDEVWDSEVKPMVADFLKAFPNAWVYFTGHSLGAALATLAVSRFSGSNCPLYTIGSPRVGDVKFVNDVQHKAKLVFRFVNSQDIVTQVPPEVLLEPYFRHVGEEKYIDRTGKIHDNPLEAVKLADMAEGIIAHDGANAIIHVKDPLHWLANLWKNPPYIDPPPYLLGNHTPARYSIRIWNFYSGH